MNDVVKDWLLSAKMDLKSIEKIIEDEFLSPVVCFHAQQCVEKSFKAFLESKSIDIPKTHDILKLFGLLRQHLNIKLNLQTIQKLNDLYIDSRYPGEIGLLPNGKPTVEEAREFYEFAKMIFENIKEKFAFE